MSSAFEPHSDRSDRQIPVVVARRADTGAPTCDPAKVRQALDILFEPSDVVELRAIHKQRKRIDAGCWDFEHRDNMIAAAEALNSVAAVYVTLNPVKAQLLGRYRNRIEPWAGKTAGDADIEKRRWLLIDVDPVRPADTSATAEQELNAHRASVAIVRYARELGWPEPVVASSGNGVHLLYRIDLPNDMESRSLIKDVLTALAARFDTDEMKVDETVFNAARIVKLYGTVANKGDHSPDAPHRLSEVKRIPSPIRSVSREQLRCLADAVSVRRNADHPSSVLTRPQTAHAFDVVEFLERYDVQYQTDSYEGGERFKLATCPFNAAHINGDAAVFRRAGGALAFKCFHNSCSDRDWRAVREHFEGPRAQLPAQIDIRAAIAAQSARCTNSTTAQDPVFEHRRAELVQNSAADDATYSNETLNPPGMVGEIAKWILATSRLPQPILAVAAALTLVSVALGRKVRTSTNLRTNLYLIGLAESGFGKDHGLDCVARALRAAGLESMVGGAELKSGAGLLSRVQTNRACVFLIDEFGRLLQSISSQKAGNWEREIAGSLMKLFSSSGRVMYGAEYADKRANPLVNIPYPCVSLYGVTVPDKLFNNLTAESVGDGFLNRLLIVEAPSTPPARLDTPFVDEVPRNIVAWLKSARAITPGLEDTGEFPVTVPTTSPAHAVLNQFTAEIDQSRRHLRNSPSRKALVEVWARAEELAVKVALVVACSTQTDCERLAKAGQQPCLEIDAGSMSWGIQFVRTVLKRMELAAGSRLGSSDHERVCQDAEMFIDRSGANGASRRDLIHGVWRFRGLKPRDQDDVLRALELGGNVIAREPDPTGRNRAVRYIAVRWVQSSVEDVGRNQVVLAA